MRRVLLSAFVLLLSSLSGLTQDPSPEVKKSIDAVRKHIDAMPNGKGAGEVLAQTATPVKTAFPEHHMILVRFRQFPVARIMPENLSASNIFAVTKEGKIEHLKDTKTLEKFFSTHSVKAKEEKDAKMILAAWLTLTQEFHQDGFFKFEVLEKEFAVDGKDELKAKGRAAVMQGGNGMLSAELTIDKDGKLAKASEKAEIRPGPRPICQATKLLDADPIVRRMAEADLLIMGLSSGAYLMEQRERATPELRRAIDQLWERIQRNGW
jgi:hypothetical protein